MRGNIADHHRLAAERRRDRSTLALFSELLAKAAHWGWIDKNPAAGVSIPRQTKAMEQRHVFDLDDEAAFIEHFKTAYERPLMEIFE